jgi:hypothetical protein
MTTYSGKIIRKTPVVPTQQSASGVWTTEDAAVAVRNNIWPVPGVPDPISRSVRLRSSASAYLNRTPAGAGSRTTWTWSAWIKRGNFSASAQKELFAVYVNATNFSHLYFDTTETLNFIDYVSGTVVTNRTSTPVYRDPSAWYHIVLTYDTTNATAQSRVRVYVNGVEITSFSGNTTPAQNYASGYINSANAHTIGQQNATYYFDGYLTEVNFIDGQALTPSSFGTTNAFTGAWIPMQYTGTYGTNGFYLDFRDNTSTTTLGYDYSGNNNTWTANNISLTAGATYDSMLDVPTPWVGYSATTDTSAVTRGNYAVMNAVSGYGGLPLTAANIQTSAVASGADWYSRSATMGISSGKWYAEFSMPSITSGAQGNPAGVGIIPASNDFSAAGQLVGDSSRGYGFYCSDTSGAAPVKRVSGSNTSVGTGSATTTTDVFMVAFDLTNGNAWFGKNGTWYAGDPSAGTGASITGITAAEYVFAVSIYRDSTFTNNTVALNFGQRPFSYTPPTGFKALCTTNLPEPTIKLGAQYMAATTYTGNGSTQSIVNSGNNTTATSFQPDWVWTKSRSYVNSNRLFDAIRGTQLPLYSNLTAAETTETGTLTAFNSNGFSLGSNVDCNTNAATYVAWQWRAGGTAVSNTAGTITSQVSVNTTAGFSIVTFVNASGTNQATVGHGLGVAPKLIISKNRDTNANNWAVFHASVCDTTSKFLKLNTTDAVATYSTVWGAALPTSSVFGVTGGGIAAASVNVIAYCFAEVAGYSKFGSYTGNGSDDGPFVYCGFRPRYVLIKRTDASDNWFIHDTSRNPSNIVNLQLKAQSSDAEASTVFDIVSNGFKVRNSFSGYNASGGTYIYAAFAETPFNYSNAR